MDKFKDRLHSEYENFMEETISFIKNRPDVMSLIKEQSSTDEVIDDDYLKEYIVDRDIINGEREHTAREQGYIQAMRDVMKKLEE